MLIPYSTDHVDALQEIVNVAMGRAGASLATILGVFVRLSVPRIQIVEASRAAQAAALLVGADKEITAVRQSFHSDVRGEAIVVYGEDGCGELADLMGYDDCLDPGTEKELLLDVSNLLVGACLCGVLEQLECSANVSFSAPSVIAERATVRSLVKPESLSWAHALVVELNFSLEQRAFTCHLLIMLPEESIDRMRQLLDRALAAL
jgi:chemotaxis protein CheC